MLFNKGIFMIINNEDLDPSKFVGFTEQFNPKKNSKYIDSGIKLMDALKLVPGKNILFNNTSRGEGRISKILVCDVNAQSQLGYWFVSDGIIYTQPTLFIHELGHLFDSTELQAKSFDFGFSE